MTADECTATDSDGQPVEVTVARLRAVGTNYDGRVRVTAETDGDGEEDAGEREWRFGVYGEAERRRVVAEQLTNRGVPAFVERVVLQTGIDAVLNDSDDEEV
jgi:YD repeat-containing protein